MTHLVCQQCGSALRLSLPEDAYLCDDHPLEHRHVRGEFEQRCVEAATEVARAAPHDSPVRVALVDALVELAIDAFRAGDEDAGRQALRNAVRASDDIVEPEGPAPVRDEALAVLSEIADYAERLDDRAMALAAYERMVVLARGACIGAASDKERVRSLSASLNGAGRMTRALGDYVQATRFFEEDLTVLGALRDAHPGDGEVLADLAAAHFNMYLVGTSRDDELWHLRAIDALLGDAQVELPARASQVLVRARQQLDVIATMADATNMAIEADPSLVETQDAPKMVAAVAARSALNRPRLVEEVRLELERRYPSGGGARSGS